MGNFENAVNFIEKFLTEKHDDYNFSTKSAKLTTDEGREISLPIFNSEDIFTDTPSNQIRNAAQKEAFFEWNRSGMLLISNYLEDDVIDDLHKHAMQKISKGADPGDHFRTTEIKLGHEGRGWAQRTALWKNSPSLLSKVLAASKKLQQLIFGDISTTTEIQFNATYSPDIGHIHIDRPAGFLSSSEAEFIDPTLLDSLNRLSFQTAFYTGDTPRSKGSTGFIPGSHRLLGEAGINSINLYATEEGRKKLSQYMFHGDIPKGLAVVFQSSVLHRTGSNQSGSTRIAYLIQNQLSSLIRMEGSVGEEKLNELVAMFPEAIENFWTFREIFQNYPFPANLADQANAPQPGSLAPRTLAQHIDEFGRGNLLKFSKKDLKKFFETKLNILHGTK